MRRIGWWVAVLCAWSVGCQKTPAPAKPALAVSVEAASRAGLAPFAVELSSSVSGADGTVTWAWDFDDGDTATVPGPLHVFTTPGTYDIALVVTDATGRTAESGLTVSVGTDEVPAVTATADVGGGQAPLLVSFTCSSASGEQPFDYVWDFGDGTVAPGADAAHTYTEAGDFTARCIVTDASGDTGMNTADVSVTPDLVPEVTVGANPAAGVAPLGVAFTTAVASGNGPFTYDWDFGNGNTSMQASDVTLYTNPGTYLARVIVTDADGDETQRAVDIAVATDSQPQVAAGASTQQGVGPLQVQFTATAAGGNGSLEYQWDFGDGALSNVPNPVHTFLGGATYTVAVGVIDEDGDLASDSLDVTVDMDDFPTPMVSFVQNSALTPSVVVLICDSPAGNAPFTFQWDFGDGVTSTLQNPTHVYAEPGSFSASCTVTDVNGDIGDDGAIVTVVQDTTPVVALGGGPFSGAAPLSVDFTSVVSGGNGPLIYSWDFGDGATVVGGAAAETHAYATAGTYGLILSVTDNDGDVGLATIEVQVN